MAHQEKLSSILSYLDDIEGDNEDRNSHNVESRYETQTSHHESSAQSNQGRRFIWDDWDEGGDNHMSSIYEEQDSIGTPCSNTSMSTISPEPSSRRGHSSFISPIDIQSHTKNNANQPPEASRVTNFQNKNHDEGNDHQSHQSASSSTSQSSSATANAFRDVQIKIKAMQTELDERSDEVMVKERELKNVRLAAETSMLALESSWKAKNEDQHYHAQAALERQREFQRTLANDIDKLKNKHEALSEQISRIIRRRDGEIGAARRQTVNNLRAEREHWVSSERSKLAKLAESKKEVMKATAVEELEPLLTELIRTQRLEMRDLEIKLRDQFAISIRKHRIQLQRSKDDSDVEARYSKSMLKEREGWSKEFKAIMSKCEDDAVKMRQDHDKAMCKERESHDHMWRQIMANKDAQVQDIRTEAAAKASKLAQYHNRSTLELSEQHALSLQRSRQRGLILEDKLHNKVKQEVIEDRLKLDTHVLKQLKSKAMKEVSMVEEKLLKQFSSEFDSLKGEFTEKRVRLTNEFDMRLNNMRFGDSTDTIDKEEDKDVYMKIEKLKTRLENDNDKINKLELEISEIRENKQKEVVKLDALNEEFNAKISEGLKKVEEVEKQTSSEALSLCRRKEALHEDYRKQMNTHENEISSLKESLADELTNVRNRVDDVLNRKEVKAAELAEALSNLTKLNDQRAHMLNKLRLDRFQ